MDYQNLAAIITVRNYLWTVLSNSQIVSKDKYKILSKIVGELDKRVIDDILISEEKPVVSEIKDSQLPLDFDQKKPRKRRNSTKIPPELEEKIALAKLNLNKSTENKIKNGEE